MLGQGDQNDLRPLLSVFESFLSMMFIHIFEAKKKAENFKWRNSIQMPLNLVIPRR